MEATDTGHRQSGGWLTLQAGQRQWQNKMAKRKKPCHVRLAHEKCVWTLHLLLAVASANHMWLVTVYLSAQTLLLCMCRVFCYFRERQTVCCFALAVAVFLHVLCAYCAAHAPFISFIDFRICIYVFLYLIFCRRIAPAAFCICSCLFPCISVYLFTQQNSAHMHTTAMLHHYAPTSIFVATRWHKYVQRFM